MICPSMQVPVVIPFYRDFSIIGILDIADEWACESRFGRFPLEFADQTAIDFLQGLCPEPV